MKELSRRSFLKGMGAAALSTAGLALTGSTAIATDASVLTYSDTIRWDGEYDVIVIGFGGAGAVSSIYAAKNGAKVLLTEKAPLGEEGGNTRICGQMLVRADTYENALAYYKRLYSHHKIDEEMLDFWCKSITQTYEKLEALGLDSTQFQSQTGKTFNKYSPEYPEFEGSQGITLNSIHDGVDDGFLWQNYRRMVTENSDNIDVWFSSPAKRFIQEPVSKTILGVVINRNGEDVNIRAKNGVVIASGGFENNPEMVETYLGIVKSFTAGTLHNTGDGIKMASAAGADLWHMDAYENSSHAFCPFVQGVRPALVSASVLKNGSITVINDGGQRSFNVNESARHGHIKWGANWVNPRFSERTYLVMDGKKYDEIVTSGKVKAEELAKLVKGETLQELAEKIDVDAATLQYSIEDFNEAIVKGRDGVIGRNVETMTAFDMTGPYYAVEIAMTMMNTQGGPRKNSKAEVIGVDGKPIPHLYVAGECGGITAFMYQGGGNMAECLIFGEVAGTNAAAAKDDLPGFEAVKVESTMRYLPGVENDLLVDTPVGIELKDNEYLGCSPNGVGGDLWVKVTMDGDKIAHIEVVKHTETAGVADPALQQIPAAIVQAQSTEVDTVSSATRTSLAIIEAVNDALSQVK